LREKTIDIWNQRWESTTKSLQTKLFFPRITDRKKAKHFTPDFQTTQVMTNHGIFKSYLNQFNIIDNNECDLCLTEDNANHRVFYCRKFDENRSEFLMNSGIDRNNWAINCQQLVDHKNFIYFKSFCCVITENLI
jgi:hypothetical protein